MCLSTQTGPVIFFLHLSFWFHIIKKPSLKKKMMCPSKNFPSFNYHYMIFRHSQGLKKRSQLIRFKKYILTSFKIITTLKIS